MRAQAVLFRLFLFILDARDCKGTNNNVNVVTFFYREIDAC